MSYYKDHYQVVIMGGGLAGMACALRLQKWGIKDILILEKHNLPGGLATDFVRDEFEIEATLHEMMSIGDENDKLKVGAFFDEMGVKIDWLKVPECYRVVVPGEGIDMTVHDGYERAARDFDAAVPGCYDKVLDFIKMMRRVYDSMNYLSTHEVSKVKMLKDHTDFVRTLGYSASEVMEACGIDGRLKELMTPYWIYVGNPLDDLPFTIYAFLMADYLTGSYVCRGYSHEMSMKMQQKVEENGAQFEFRQEVEKILVKDGKVTGVRTARGDVIHADYVVSAAYPNKVYTQMIEPASEVPPEAIQMINARKLSVCPVSIILVLEGTPEENGITNYSTFSGDTLDTNAIWQNGLDLSEPFNYITTICLNYANPKCVPEGYTQLSITALHLVEPWLTVTEDEYFDMKRRLANEMIEKCLEVTKVDFRDRIVELEVETPVTVAHYVGAWKGSIYGYSHSMDDHAVARKQMPGAEDFIEGLTFAGAHAISGDGMGPAITNGQAAAKAIHDDLARKGAAK